MSSSAPSFVGWTNGTLPHSIIAGPGHVGRRLERIHRDGYRPAGAASDARNRRQASVLQLPETGEGVSASPRVRGLAVPLLQGQNRSANATGDNPTRADLNYGRRTKPRGERSTLAQLKCRHINRDIHVGPCLALIDLYYILHSRARGSSSAESVLRAYSSAALAHGVDDLLLLGVNAPVSVDRRRGLALEGHEGGELSVEDCAAGFPRVVIGSGSDELFRFALGLAGTGCNVVLLNYEETVIRPRAAGATGHVLRHDPRQPGETRSDGTQEDAGRLGAGGWLSRNVHLGGDEPEGAHGLVPLDPASRTALRADPSEFLEVLQP